MPIKGYKSLCDCHAKVIVSKDKRGRQKHIATNVSNSYVTHYQVDGNIMSSNNESKCDFILINEDDERVFFIELKGSDILHALEQLDATEKSLSNHLIPYNGREYRVVLNRVNTHDVRSAEFIRYKRKWGKFLIYQNGVLKENI